MADNTGDHTLQSLSATLNRLSQKGLSLSERDEERRNLAAFAANFNDVSAPTAQKLWDALPDITDYGARWITAKMLRDAGLKSEEEGEIALLALTSTFIDNSDPGSRQMASGLIRDLGVKHEGLAVQAAVGLSMLLSREDDQSARFAEKNALMALAMKYEHVSPVASEYIGKALLAENDAQARIMISGDLRTLGTAYPTQASSAMRRIATAADKETDEVTAQHYAHDIAGIALHHPSTAAQAVETLSAGFRAGTNILTLSGYAHSLALIGAKHPAPVIAEMAGLLEEGLGSDQRRMLFVSLKDLADTGGVTSSASVATLKNALAREDVPFNRRLIVEGLMTGVRAEASETEGVKETLKAHLSNEKDPETYKHVERHLRSLGYVKPFAGNVVGFQPKMA